MNDTAHLLQRLQVWYQQIAQALTDEGYIVEFVGPIPERPKLSASVFVSSTRRMAKLTIWATGETELDLGDITTGVMTEEHREITGSVGFADATQTLIGWLIES